MGMGVKGYLLDHICQ